MSALTFIERVHERLQARGWGDDYHAGMVGDRIANMLTASSQPSPAPIREVAPDALRDISNDRMIHEMLERGFAVIKMPAHGGLPDSLK